MDKVPAAAGSIAAQPLLNLWEMGQRQTPIERALLLLALVHPGVEVDELAGLPVGQRDAKLLRLREALFGDPLACAVSCPQCSAMLEFSLSVSALLSLAIEDRPPNELHIWQGDGYLVEFRLPTSQDVMAALAASLDQQTALMEACVTSLRRDGSRVSGKLPPGVQSAVAHQMLALDPLADVQLELACNACAHQWEATFDIVTYFWQELDRWANRTLEEVHLLAGAYSWTETNILTLSASRRRAYLEMVYG